MNRLYIMLLAVTLLSVAGCDSYVESVDQPINSIDDLQLNDESQVGFVIKGIQSRFSTAYDRLAVFAGGLSDELIFDQNVRNATFPSFQEMDIGDITFANNSNDGLYDDIGELRLFSDNLLDRVGAIEFTDADLKNEAEFTAQFYGGVARYFYAAYYGLDKRQGGGVITEDPQAPGPFIGSTEMYGLALDKLSSARALADDYHTRVINTLIARIHLFQGNYSDARAAASAGMADGDDPFSSLHSVDNSNYYYDQAGVGRNQWVVDFRFHDYVVADPAEALRIPLTEIVGVDETTLYYRQNRYPERETPLPFATWQENALMLAELDIRDGNAGSALDLINAVRASHTENGLALAPLAAADLDVLTQEREKELFTMGLRLPDQRRLDLWHLGDDTWWFLPITQNERNINDNF